MTEQEVRDLLDNELQKRSPEMSADEKLQEARDMRDSIQANALWAEQRSASIADEYIRLQVQIATIIFAFGSLFLDNFTPDKLVKFNADGIFTLKLAFAVSMSSLAISLAFGLFYLKVNEDFWDAMLRQRIIRFKKWDKAARRETTFEEAHAYHEGSGLERGNTVPAPQWPWKLQTIFLALAITILFILATIYLFAQHGSTPAVVQ